MGKKKHSTSNKHKNKKQTGSNSSNKRKGNSRHYSPSILDKELEAIDDLDLGSISAIENNLMVNPLLNCLKGVLKLEPAPLRAAKLATLIDGLCERTAKPFDFSHLEVRMQWLRVLKIQDVIEQAMQALDATESEKAAEVRERVFVNMYNQHTQILSAVTIRLTSWAALMPWPANLDAVRTLDFFVQTLDYIGEFSDEINDEVFFSIRMLSHACLNFTLLRLNTTVHGYDFDALAQQFGIWHASLHSLNPNYAKATNDNKFPWAQIAKYIFDLSTIYRLSLQAHTVLKQKDFTLAIGLFNTARVIDSATHAIQQKNVLDFLGPRLPYTPFLDTTLQLAQAYFASGKHALSQQQLFTAIDAFQQAKQNLASGPLKSIQKSLMHLEAILAISEIACDHYLKEKASQSYSQHYSKTPYMLNLALDIVSAVTLKLVHEVENLHSPKVKSLCERAAKQQEKVVKLASGYFYRQTQLRINDGAMVSAFKSYQNFNAIPIVFPGDDVAHYVNTFEELEPYIDGLINDLFAGALKKVRGAHNNRREQSDRLYRFNAMVSATLSTIKVFPKPEHILTDIYLNGVIALLNLGRSAITTVSPHMHKHSDYLKLREQLSVLRDLLNEMLVSFNQAEAALAQDEPYDLKQRAIRIQLAKEQIQLLKTLSLKTELKYDTHAFKTLLFKSRQKCTTRTITRGIHLFQAIKNERSELAKLPPQQQRPQI